MVDPNSLDVASRCLAGLGREHPGEVARAHADKAGECLDTMVPVGRDVDQFLGFSDGVVFGPPCPYGSGELALTTGTTQEHDEMASNPLGQIAAVIRLDEGQRQVDTRRHPGRGPHLAVVDEDRIGVDGDGGVALGELLGAPPMGRGSSSNPASANSSDPLHTEATRRLPAPARRIHATSARSSSAVSTPSPPGTTSVSKAGRRGSGRSATMARPLDPRMVPGSAAKRCTT
jgi:hypothetical protein